MFNVNKLMIGCTAVGVSYLTHCSRRKKYIFSVKCEELHDIGNGTRKVDAGTDRNAHCDTSRHSTYRLKLISSQVFMRHGARTPLKHMPAVEEVVYDSNMLVGGNNPEKCRSARTQYTDIPYTIQSTTGGPRPPTLADDKYRTIRFKGGLRAGVMTALGRDQAYMLGQRLRQKYMEQHGLLNAVFDASEVYLRSTNFDRTIDTVQCVLAGIYGKQAFKEPAVIIVCDMLHEFLFPNGFYCPTIQKSYGRMAKELNTVEFVCRTKAKLRSLFNLSDDTEIQLVEWMDNITARQAHGLPLPDGLTELRDDIVEALAIVSELWINQEMITASCGRLLNEMKSNLINAAESKPNVPKLYLYSCHDTTLFPLRKALGIHGHQWPPYCAALEVDLLRDEENPRQYYVRVSYLGEEKIMEGQNEAVIPVEEFYKIINKYCRTYKQLLVECGYDGDIEKFEFPPNM